MRIIRIYCAVIVMQADLGQGFGNGILTQFELNLIKGLQGAVRSPFLDWFFYIISFAGAEYFFLGTAAVFLWCINKRFGYKFLNVYFIGQIFVGAIKTIVRRTRPFDAGAGVESVISETEGYSFPSGHSQGIANISTQTALFARNASNDRGGEGRNKLFVRVAIVGGVVTALVMFSRMYLGQHYLSDVLCGAALGVLVALVFSRVFELLGDREERLAYIILPLTVVFAIVFVAVGDNIGGAMKLFGVWGAISLGYFLEKKYVRYEVKSGGILRQIVKIAIGLCVIVVLLEVPKILDEKLNVRAMLVVEYLRYFLAGISATFAMPAFFKRVGL